MNSERVLSPGNNEVPKDINQAPEIWLHAWILYYNNALLMTCSMSRALGQKISSEIGTSTTFTRFNTM
jgi:hypothetical protein